jgi:hypothetical protein
MGRWIDQSAVDYHRHRGQHVRFGLMEVPLQEALFTVRHEVHPRRELEGVPSLNIEAKYSSETSVPTRPTWRCHIPKDGTRHSRRRENLKSYIALTSWTL